MSKPSCAQARPKRSSPDRITPALCRQAQAAGAELFGQTVAFRLIKIVLPNGTLEVLATSLTDTTAFPTQDFADLYHARWGIEEAFKRLKHRLNVEEQPLKRSKQMPISLWRRLKRYLYRSFNCLRCQDLSLHRFDD